MHIRHLKYLKLPIFPKSQPHRLVPLNGSGFGRRKSEREEKDQKQGRQHRHRHFWGEEEKEMDGFEKEEKGNGGMNLLV